MRIVALSAAKIPAVVLAALLVCAPAARALEDDRLAWSRSDTQVHLGASFAGSLLGTELLEWRGYPTWKATLLSSLLVGAAGATKELALDDFVSGSDLMADGIGIGANALLQFTIRF